MIYSLDFDDKRFMLADPDAINDGLNVFTVIVGRNGTGKSRMLGGIAANVIIKSRTYSRKRYYDRELFSNGYPTLYGDVSFSTRPVKLIAVSTSPFDRFPLRRPDSKGESPEYSYLGIRELTTRNFGLAYMSKIMAELIDVAERKRSQVAEIMRVLEYLGYAGSISMRMESRVPEKFMEEILKRGPEYFEDDRKLYRPAFLGFNRYFFYNEDGTVSKTKVKELIKVFSKLRNKLFPKNRTVHLELDHRGITTDFEFADYLQDFIFLLRTGLLRLRDVTLTKRQPVTNFSISDASSGEQAVMISLLGIASQIQNGAIICIDEPEICLHPEWQERYIKMLTSTFSLYSGCHFVIATHSPQIVSNLEPYNSYILSAETGQMTHAKNFVGHSSDFQLANVFNSPGFKNEYLSRIALNIFAKVSKNKTFDKEDMTNYRLLKGQRKYLSQDDPVYQLFVALNEMYQTYGRH